MRTTLTGLRPETVYHFRARSKKEGAVSEWSNVFDFTTISTNTPPSIPQNVTWVSAGDAFHGEWDEVTTNILTAQVTILKYDVELIQTSTSNRVVVAVAGTSGRNTYDLPFSTFSALFGGSPGGEVKFRVRAVNSVGIAGEWSAQVTAGNAPPAAVTNLTASGLVNQIILNWTAPDDDDLLGYNVYVGTTFIWFGNATSYTYYTGTYTPITFTVKAVDKFNQESAGVDVTGTAVNPFIVDTTAPDVPTLTSVVITNNPTGVGATAAVNWSLTSPPIDLSGFVVRYRAHGTTDAWVERNFSDDTTSGSVELAKAYTNYDFQIRAYDFSANYSPWSAVTNATSPANTAPADVTGVSATSGRDSIFFSWTPVADQDIKNYEVTLSTVLDFSNNNRTFFTGTAPSINIGGLTPSTNYYLRVRAVDTAGLTSVSWSSTYLKPTLPYTVNSSDGVVPGTSPTPVVTGGIGYLNVSWAPVTVNALGASQNDLVTYEVHLSTTSNFTPSGATKAAESLGTNAALELTPAGTPLAYSTTYYVKIIAKDRDGSAATSAQGSGTLGRVGPSDSTLTATDVGAASPLYVQSRGMNLVTNGTALLGTNYNFSPFTLVTTDSPGGGGSFQPAAGVSGAPNNDELIPVLTEKTYTYSYYIRQAGTSTTGCHYSIVICYDIDGLQISPQFTMYQANTLTTLAAPLNPGDTTVTLTSTANWNNAAGGANVHLRGFIFWDYVDGKGKAWPANTYSRNAYLGQYADGGINFGTNTITLSAPWSGPAKASGTQVSNSASGGTYKYIAAVNVVAPSTWTPYSGQIGGVDTAGANNTYKFHPGTAFVKIGWLTNRTSAGPSDTNSTMRFGNVWFSEVSAANLPEIAVAQTTANGKNKSVFSTSPASGTVGYVAGDIWFQRDAGSNIIAQWEYTGSAWASRTLSDTTISSLNVGKLLSGSITSTDITLGTGGYIRSTDYNQSSKIGWRIGTGGLEIWDGTIQAKALSITVGGGNVLSNSSFEYGITTSTPGTNWNVYNNSAGLQPITVTSVTGRRGGLAPRLTWSVANTTTKGIYPGGINVGLPKPLTTYTLSFYARANNGTAMSVGYNTPPASNVWVQNPAPSATVWQRYIYRFTTGATADAIGFYLSLVTSAAGYIEYDDIQLEEGDVATAYTPRVDEILPGTISADMFNANMAFVSTLNINSGGVIQSVGYTGASGFQITDTAINIRSGSVNANTLVAGTGIVNNLVVNTGGAIQSGNFDATHGFQLSSTGLIIRQGSVLADVIGPGSLTSAINIAAGASLILNGGYLKSNTYTGTTQATNPSGAGFYLGNDGLRIDQGIIKAEAFAGGTFTGGNIIVGAGGSIRSSNYAAGTTGWSLSTTGLEINNGSIKASALQIQNSVNLLPMEYASFETTAAAMTVNDVVSNNDPATIAWSYSPNAVYGTQSLKVGWGTISSHAYLYLGRNRNDYNIPLQSGATYILSAYVWTEGTVPTDVGLNLHYNNDTYAQIITGFTTTASGSPATATRVTSTFTVPAGVSGAVIYLSSITHTALAGFNIDGVQLELQTGALTTPSPWHPGSVTTIDGGSIRTGSIISNSLTGIGGQPLWSIPLNGSATFQNLLVRGVSVVGVAGDGTGSLLQSYNYSPGTAGWKIDSIGNAEFNTATLRGKLITSLIGGGSTSTRIEIEEKSLTDKNGSTYTRGVMSFYSGVFGENPSTIYNQSTIPSIIINSGSMAGYPSAYSSYINVLTGSSVNDNMINMNSRGGLSATSDGLTYLGGNRVTISTYPTSDAYTGTYYDTGGISLSTYSPGGISINGGGGVAITTGNYISMNSGYFAGDMFFCQNYVGSGTVNITSTGYTNVMSVGFSVPNTNASYLVTVMADVQITTNGTINVIQLNVNGVAQSGNIVTYSAGTATRGMYSKTWKVSGMSGFATITVSSANAAGGGSASLGLSNSYVLIQRVS